MAEKQDRRIRKTKAQLKHGLAKLMQTKSINDITVKELVEAVDINRSTFYLHYTDIHDLLAHIEDESKTELIKLMNSLQPETLDDGVAFISDILQFTKDNHELATALLGYYGEVSYRRQLESIIYDRCKNFFMSFVTDEYANQLDFITAYSISGFMGLVIEWIKQDFQRPVEDMAKTAYTLILASIKPYIA